MNDSLVTSQMDSAFLASSNLTQNQFLMWMGQQLDPQAALYNMVLVFTLDGEIAPDTFQRAFQKLVDRSDALRTVFEVIGGVPQQRVVAYMPYTVELLDLSGTPGPEQAFRDWVEQRKVRQLDLGTCSFDSALIKLTPTRFKWYFNQHHILTDGWSAALIFEQMGHFYQLAREKRLDEAPVLNAYQTYVAHERKFRQTESYRQAQSYWRDKLLRPIDPFDFFGRQLSGRSYRIHRVDHRLGEERTQLLKTRAQEAGVRLLSQDLALYTVFMTVLFAYLHRISGQSRLRIGSPFHNRPSPAFKGTIGLFIEMGLLQVDVLPNDTFASLLKKVQSEVFASLRYAQPGISNAESNRACNVLLNYTYSTFLDFDGLPTQSEWVHSGFGDSNQGLWLQIHDFDQANNILVQFEFNEEVFEPAQRGRVIEHFVNLFDAFLHDRDQAIGQIDFLSAKERQAIQSFSQVREATSAQHTIVELFEAQVSRTPEAIAVVYQDQRVTYAELNRRSNQLAHHLRQLGIKANDFVAMYVDRSLEMVVGILGVLKAGGAYLPLDPAYPIERLDFMLQDSQASILLTQSHMVGDLPAFPGEIRCLDSDWEMIAEASDENPERITSPFDLAYSIYTSGSTGKPKGVLVSHRNVVRLFASTHHWYRFDQTDVWSLFHSYAFDVSVYEMWGALFYGGRLVVVPYWTSRSFEDFYKLLCCEKVTVLSQTPSAFRQLIRAEEMVGVSPDLALRLVICAGEALELESLRPWFERHSDRAPQVVNMYGTTETTVHATYRPIRASDLEAASGSVIGVPIPDLELYILDQQQQLVPIGVTGEMYIGGAGVSKGYLNRPELTAERFIINPFKKDSDPASRLYRTGDLARFLPERDIEFLGRIDHQVKIRGFRVELGEIETVLRQHPGIGDAVVLPIQNASDDKRLVAYIVPDPRNASTVLRVLNAKKNNGLLNRSLYELPNGMVVVYLNQNETAFMYDEIFERRTYLKHGISLDDGACIFDVGANIGLFTLQAGQICRNPKIYAFEPIPPVSEILHLNTELYGIDAQVFDYGLGSTTGMATFSFYPHVSIFSGLFANASEERETVKSLLLNQASENDGFLMSDEQLDELLKERLVSEQVTCHIKTLSQVIDDHNIERIDLLKVDVEKSEMDVLNGIDNEDWPKIQQVVVEVHNTDHRLQQITGLLEEHGFAVTVEQEAELEESNLYNVYATRPDQRETTCAEVRDQSARQAGQRWNSPGQLVDDVRQFLKERLPDYMVPAGFALLETIPLTPNGKLDHKALPELDTSRPTWARGYVAPETETEQALATIWQEALGLDQVGRHDNFFDLGGDSISVMRVMIQVSQALGIESPPKMLFETPTLADFAGRIEDSLIAEIDNLSDEEAELLLANLD